MRLYLAVAVLMLALIAYTEAQEESIGQKFNNFGEKVSEATRNLADRIKSGVEEVNNSEFMTNAREKVSGWFQKLGAQLGAR